MPLNEHRSCVVCRVGSGCLEQRNLVLVQVPRPVFVGQNLLAALHQRWCRNGGWDVEDHDFCRDVGRFAIVVPSFGNDGQETFFGWGEGAGFFVLILTVSNNVAPRPTRPVDLQDLTRR